MPTPQPRFLPVFVVLASLIPLGWLAAEQVEQAEKEDPPKLLGLCTPEQLDEEPYAEWSRKGYADYAPDPATVAELRRLGHDRIEMTIFFGTWCGDSRREVPRMLRLLDAIDFPEAQLRLIAVDNQEGAIKRSPGSEERGLEIYRVPTLVVARDGTEVARIVEYPVLSLERDLVAILSGSDYRPNYASYPRIRRWLREGLLADENVSPRGLAGQLRSLISEEGELQAVARVLFDRGDTAEAVKLFRTNCALYRESARCYARLGDALMQSGDVEEARSAVERAIRLDPDREEMEELVDLLGRALGASGEPTDG